jgi:LPXTG-motif cell wall-anchored protein
VAGPGVPSDAQDASPAAPAGVPTNVVATTGPSSVKVTWDAPATTGTYPVAGYEVGWSGGEMGSKECDVAADQPRVCVFPIAPGTEITAVVFAVDSKGNAGEPAFAPVGEVPAPTVPATVPASNGDLVRPAGETGSVVAGKEITLTGSGYLPNSTVTVAIYSDPQVLTQVVTDGTGAFTVTVTVPAGLTDGDHTLVASGVDASGAVRYMTLPITVTGGLATATGPATAGLADTGADVALPLAGGALALLLGGGILVASRRRAHA